MNCLKRLVRLLVEEAKRYSTNCSYELDAAGAALKLVRAGCQAQQQVLRPHRVLGGGLPCCCCC